MLVGFDTNMLSLLFHQTDRFPNDPTTGKPITKPKERIQALIQQLAKDKATIIIPTPALAEFLVVVDSAGPGYLKVIEKNANFEVAEFDEVAAVEAAFIYKELQKQSMLHSKDEPKQKVKVDIQIIAVAKTRGVNALYSTDPNLIARAKKMKMIAVGLWEIPEPAPVLRQMTLAEAPPQDEPPKEVSLKAVKEDSTPEKAKLVTAVSETSSIATEQPSSQSLGDGQVKEPLPEPLPPSAPQAAPVPPPQDSSQAQAKPQTEK